MASSHNKLSMENLKNSLAMENYLTALRGRLGELNTTEELAANRLGSVLESLAELEAKLLKAAASLDAGKGVDGEEVFARLRQRSKARRRNG